MISGFPTVRRHPIALAAFSGLLAGALALPGPARARVWVGFGFPFYFGPPAYYPPPVYYPPPAYYPPPPYYPPPAAYTPGYGTPPGQACYAGATVCPMERPVGSGSACYCTTAQGRVWGRAS
jgi:hypothetical protein